MARWYVTTAIFYPNAVPHLGTAYEAIGTDAAARWRRLRGDDVFFLSGNDEHALKVAQVAASRGQTPMDYCDEMAAAFEDAWRALGVSYDEYVRTTQRRHRDTVAWFLRRIQDGDARRAAAGEPTVLYKSTYAGLYCVGCEAFLREKDLVGGRCPQHPDRQVQHLEEDNWFFRLSAFEARLREWYASHPGWLRPESKRNEMLALMADGLQDFSISRPRKSIEWGIPFPGDADHVVYVWFEALMNYVSAARLAPDGRPRADEPGRGPGFWPADLHVVGKDIVRFHAVTWPAMLWAADLALPRALSVHGYVLTGGVRLSKSAGGTLSPVDVAREYGTDTLRYFLLREVPWGGDGEFSLERLEERYAADLANTLGNLVHRTLTLIERNFEGETPERSDNDYSPEGDEIHSVGAFWMLALARRRQALRCWDALEFSRALDLVLDVARQANLRMDTLAPWKLVKEPTGAGRRVAGDFLHAVVAALRDAAVLLSPALPSKALDLWLALGLDEEEFAAVRLGAAAEGHKDVENLEELHEDRVFAALDAIEVAGRTVRKGAPLFPRREPAGPA